ncbi:uncharacterized protein PHACADRAFT_210344 [Phanerochaete carnosa HHB-10118-sp]|uniref:BTB domain-containing protein n=1 Tax=Phanerochaete carnosa (strain HHB-10118-sp) TaxID=650164 RepID=K5UWU9_PHACS|nr:uncharacterized protein PHACADRAFT_210344 [Phanerochaete carnosa HHB-10118-sp]EKM54546.1 hypothetical protein PHACADRAFT_210344 [Phanerochaete carnosa HHB-10118-sp]
MSSQPQAIEPAQVKRSGRFYFQDLFIRAEDTLFKVHRQDFESGSEVFRHMFELPSAYPKDEGSSAEFPLVLEGIRAAELEDFLAVLYSRSSNSASAPMSLERWKAVFKLATMWDFEGVRTQALSAFKEHMRGANSMDTILLYQELHLNIDEDFVLAAQSIIEREEEVSCNEAEKLELGTIMRLWKEEIIAEDYKKHGKGYEGTGVFVDIDDNEELDAVDDVGYGAGNVGDGFDDEGPAILSAPTTGGPGGPAASPSNESDM